MTISPRRILVLTALGVTAVWLVVLAVWHEAPFALTFDDAFYYFGIARNVAHGHGSTFDGINLTNGYHPLWMLLAVPVYLAGFDGTGAVRLLLAFQVLCYGAALVLVAVVAGRAIDGWPRLRAVRPADAASGARWCTGLVAVVLAVLAANPYVVKIFANGLESGVLVLIDAAILAIGATLGGRFLDPLPRGRRLGIGVVLALAFLARTDSVFLLAALGLWAVAEARPLGRRAVGPLAELFAPAAVVAVAYLVSNQLWFGLPIQISGLTKRAPLTMGRGIGFALACAVAVAIGVWGFRRSGRSARAGGRFRRVGAFTGATAWFAAFCVVVVAYYQLLQSQQWLWYYAPIALYVLYVAVLGTADFAESALAEAADRPVARALLPVGLILVIPLVAAFVWQGRTFADPHQRSIELANRDAGEWIDANLPADSVLASWDAGVVGYYANRPVMNLDGVANSYAYYQASRNGETGRFLTDRRLRFVVNHGTPVDGEDPDIRSFLTETFGPEVGTGAAVLQRWPFVFSGVTAGSGGTGSGTRLLDVFLYALP